MQVAQSQTASQGSFGVFVYLAVEASVLKVDIRVDESDEDSCYLNTVDDVDHIATVKGSGDVVLKAVLEPDTPEIRNLLTWDGAVQQADKITAKVSRSAAMKQDVHAKINGNTCREGNVWVVWAPISQLITSDPPGQPADSTVGPEQFPQGNPTSFGANHGNNFYNGVLSCAQIQPSEFSNHYGVVEYRFVRTVERNIWIKDSGTWAQQVGAYKPPATPDGPTDISEDLIPSSVGNIYNTDIPGLGFSTNSTVPVGVEEWVYMASFVQHTEVKLNCLDWARSSEDGYLHSVSWAEVIDSRFTRKTGKNEIGAGSITVGNGNQPPGL